MRAITAFHLLAVLLLFGCQTPPNTAYVKGVANTANKRSHRLFANVCVLIGAELAKEREAIFEASKVVTPRLRIPGSRGNTPTKTKR